MIDVLVIGAGPTGLTLASELRRFGLTCRVIDKNPGRSRFSKALGVQARTLETFEIMGGPELAREAVDAGQKAAAANFTLDHATRLRLELSEIESDYPYILVIEQSETERILEEHLRRLGGTVEWNREASAIEQSGSTVRATLQDGETIEARYLVGCDGAHSLVRKQLGIPFVGEQYEGSFILADAIVDWPFPDGETQSFVNSSGVLICFPMRGERKFRFILVLNEGRDAPERVSFEEFTAKAAKFIPPSSKIVGTEWLTPFRVHHRMVTEFRKGRGFVAGDAAHIHSPAGGQGMNTGIQDAVNLAWKLAYVVQGRARETLLESYSEERLPVARAVLKGTDLIFRLALRQSSPLFRPVRSLVLPWLTRQRLATRRIARFVSETGIRYRSSAVLGSGAGERFREFRKAQPDTRDVRHLLLSPRSVREDLFAHVHSNETLIVRPDGMVGYRGDQAGIEDYVRKLGLEADPRCG